MVGGNYIPEYRSFEGPNTIRRFLEYEYDIGFLGTNGIDETNIYTGAKLESEAKKAIIKNAKKTYILTENNKWYKKGKHRIANINDVNIITRNPPVIHKNIIDIHSR